jgi:hypothetical protein
MATYNLKDLDRSQLSMIRKMVRDNIASASISVEYRSMEDLAAEAAKATEARKSKKEVVKK